MGLDPVRRLGHEVAMKVCTACRRPRSSPAGRTHRGHTLYNKFADSQLLPDSPTLEEDTYHRCLGWGQA